MPIAEKERTQRRRFRGGVIIWIALNLLAAVLVMRYYYYERDIQFRMAKDLRSQEVGGLLDFVQDDPGLRIHSLGLNQPDIGDFTVRIVADDQAVRDRLNAVLRGRDRESVVWDVALRADIRDLGALRKIEAMEEKEHR